MDYQDKVFYGITYYIFDGQSSLVTDGLELVRCTNCKGYGFVAIGQYECPECENEGSLIDIEEHELQEIVMKAVGRAFCCNQAAFIASVAKS